MATNGEALREWKSKNREADLAAKSTYRARERRRRDLIRETLAEENTNDHGESTT